MSQQAARDSKLYWTGGVWVGSAQGEKKARRLGREQGVSRAKKSRPEGRRMWDWCGLLGLEYRVSAGGAVFPSCHQCEYVRAILAIITAYFCHAAIEDVREDLM